MTNYNRNGNPARVVVPIHCDIADAVQGHSKIAGLFNVPGVRLVYETPEYTHADL